mmetsp:Transcript_67365/g.179105  ORF Transcript_67365/g.179105 Transcript_67365/m.179105 type:complete len:282 (-) Transcript_67365:257-1102(-)
MQAHAAYGHGAVQERTSWPVAGDPRQHRDRKEKELRVVSEQEQGAVPVEDQDEDVPEDAHVRGQIPDGEHGEERGLHEVRLSGHGHQRASHEETEQQRHGHNEAEEIPHETGLDDDALVRAAVPVVLRGLWVLLGVAQVRAARNQHHGSPRADVQRQGHGPRAEAAPAGARHAQRGARRQVLDVLQRKRDGAGHGERAHEVRQADERGTDHVLQRPGHSRDRIGHATRLALRRRLPRRLGPGSAGLRPGRSVLHCHLPQEQRRGHVHRRHQRQVDERRRVS